MMEESRSKSQEAIISLVNVSLAYYKRFSLHGMLSKKGRGRVKFRALQSVTLDIFVDDVVGIVGRNGSGKSTLSRVCAGILPPDDGIVSIRGKAQLLSVGVGFQPKLTGRDNVYISGTILGLSKSQIDEVIHDVEDFAAIGDYFDEPVRTYSSGMRSRLGFAIATAVKPDVLILDEIMAVGDKAFKEKALERIQNLQGMAKAVLLVSHNPAQLKRVCNKVVWVEQGKIVLQGGVDDVIDTYLDFCDDPSIWRERNSAFFDI